MLMFIIGFVVAFVVNAGVGWLIALAMSAAPPKLEAPKALPRFA
jgi:hypothetical protein